MSECTCGRPTAGAWLCHRCQTTLSWAVVNVAAYFGDLDIIATRRARYGTPGPMRHSVGKTQPLVTDLRFTGREQTLMYDGRNVGRKGRGDELRWEARNTVSTWCRVVMDDQPETDLPAGPICDRPCLDSSCNAIRLHHRRRWPADTVSSMSHYLARQFRWIVSQHWCPEMLDEFLDLERRLSRFCDRPAEAWYAGPCTAGQDSLEWTALCGVDLYVRLGQDVVECADCGWTYHVADRRAWLLAAAEDRWETATVIARAVKVLGDDADVRESYLAGRIRDWATARAATATRSTRPARLRARDTVEVGGRLRPRYRIGDVLDLLNAEARDTAGKVKAG